MVVEHFLELHTQKHGGADAGWFGRWALEYANPGRIGVVAFFLVSGYVIPMSLEAQSQRTFWIRRFFRLYPAYWVSVLAFVAVTWPALSSSLSPKTLVLNTLMVQGLLGTLSLLPPGWTLGIELLFYAQSAAAALRARLDQAIGLGWAWLAGFAVLTIGTQVTGRDLHPTVTLLLFTASIGHALHVRDSHGSKRWWRLLAAGAIVVPIGAHLSQGRSPAAHWGWQPLAYWLSWYLGVGLFWGFYALRHRRFGRTLVWLGSISYATYLLHPTVFALFARPFGEGSLLTLVLASLTLFPIAWALHVWLERPAINAGRKLSRRPSG